MAVNYIPEPLQPHCARAMFGVMRIQTRAYDLFKLPVISTGRPFEFYRRIFFDGRSEQQVFKELWGKRIVDVGCGLTPYLSNSMFQACEAAGIEFYGVDPKIGKDFRFGAFDRLKSRVTGGATLDPEAPGTAERALAAFADQLPFADGSVDLMLSSWLLTVWLQDEALLARILAEAYRVLKPGGELRCYPQPHWPSYFHSEVFWQAAHRFEIRQDFKVGVLPLSSPPAYMTTLRKK